MNAEQIIKSLLDMSQNDALTIIANALVALANVEVKNALQSDYVTYVDSRLDGLIDVLANKCETFKN
jgi:hypothetical protein